MADDQDAHEQKTILLREPPRQQAPSPPEDEMENVALLVCLDRTQVTGTEDGKYWLTSHESVVGRGPGCSVVVQSSEISREHVKISAFTGKWLVEDLGSRNGVWINRKRVTGRAEVVDGDTVNLGRVAFRFEVLQMTPETLNQVRLHQVLNAPEDEASSLEDTGSLTRDALPEAPPAPTPASTAAVPDESEALALELERFRDTPSEPAAGESGAEIASRLQPHLPAVLDALIEKARAGDVDAIRLFLEQLDRDYTA